MQGIKILICGIYLILSWNIFAQSKILDSINKLEKIIQIYTQRDSVRLEYLINLSRYIWRNNPTKALEHAHEAVDIAHELQKPTLKLKSYINLAKLYNLHNRHIDAIRYYQKARDICKELHDTITLGEIYFGLATIYRYKEQYKKAKEYNERALSILNNSKYDNIRAKIYNNMGIMYDKQTNYEKAIEYYTKSLAIKQRLNDTTGMAITLSNLAILHSYEGKYKDDKKAKEYMEKAQKIAYTMKDYNLINYTNMYLGNILSQNKKYEDALKQYENVLKSYKKDEYDGNYLQTLLNAAKTYYAMEKYTKTLEYLNLFQKYNEKTKNIPQQREAFELFSQVYQAQGNYKLALEYQKQENILKDTLLDRYKKEQELLAENDYELLHVEQSNEKLKALNEIQKERLRKQGITIAFVVVAFTLASILVILLIYSNSRHNYYLRTLENRNQIINTINAELQKNNEVKDKLFSIISHDLRSPLATIKGLLILIRDEPNLSEEYKIYLNQISKSLDNTFILLDNLLKWSSAQMQNLKVKPASFPIQGLINEVIELYQPVAQEKNIHLINYPTEEEYLVHADRDMLHLVLRNLISNAIKFTNEGGKIEIKTEKKADEVVVYVKDSGVGIPQKDLPKIFEGLTTRGTASEKGTGLGLQLCKEFIVLNHGKLNVQSTENEGSTFSFTVPLTKT